MKRYALTALLFSASVLTAQVTSNWTGGGDGSDFFDTLNWDNGVPTFQDTANFGSIADGSFINFSSGDIDVAGLEINTLGLDGGVTLSGENAVFINNHASVNGGGIFADGFDKLVDIGFEADFEIFGTDDFTFTGRDIQNNGTFTLSGTNQVTLSNSTFNNLGSLLIENSANLFNDGNGLLNNTGGDIVYDAPGSIAVGWDVVNDNGRVAAVQGKLGFQGPYQQDNGDTVVANFAEIAFHGTTVFNSGRILGEGLLNNNTGSAIDVFATFVDAMGNPEAHIINGDPQMPGKLTFSGDYTFDENTVFFFDIMGPGSTEYDQVEFVSGLADFNAGPDIIIYGDASIKSTVTSVDLFDIVTGDYVGIFSTLSEGSQIFVFNNDPLGSPLLGTFDIFYTTGAIQLGNFTPVPEPQTWALIGLGAGLIGLWARRRFVRKAA
ncbi:PEP-CTERM sorting domain-containing protein [Cerasicoccus arenae]|uniref:Ice-binding protein C-terminal domain-containing protein n=1 Tax=Cerasicoccus arenae TaxID=424488 RepID=A0A8J3DJB1_9BACT|nr:PEP-CTERM sorting domain-containing protein [Cerasicoccus arenae]MBK1858782.1 PEP-CTERM sorting domain-containing protein [Cerasicoccus arenae]GHC07423.1 hypothetical protein GCM10007047_25750 [Cerasicoccus arenae]